MCVFGRFSLVSYKYDTKSKHKLNRGNATTLDENDNRNMRLSYGTRMNVRIRECDVKNYAHSSSSQIQYRQGKVAQSLFVSLAANFRTRQYYIFVPPRQYNLQIIRKQRKSSEQVTMHANESNSLGISRIPRFLFVKYSYTSRFSVSKLKFLQKKKFTAILGSSRKIAGANSGENLLKANCQKLPKTAERIHGGLHRQISPAYSSTRGTKQYKISSKRRPFSTFQSWFSNVKLSLPRNLIASFTGAPFL